MRRNTPSNKLIRGSRCPCPIGGSRRACGACRASRRRAEQSSRHGQQAGRPRCRWAAAGPGRASRRRAKRTISNQAPAVWRPPQGLRGLASVPVGGGRAWPGFETTRQANDQQPSAGGVEAAAGPAGPGRGAGGRRQGQGGLSGRAKLRPVGGCRGACGAWPRCRRAAAGPGRASRSITPSRRLACGDLAGGPPPTGTHSGQTQQDGPRGGRARRRPENPWCHKPRPKVRTPRSTPGSGRPDDRRGDRGR